MACFNFKASKESGMSFHVRCARDEPTFKCGTSSGSSISASKEESVSLFVSHSLGLHFTAGILCRIDDTKFLHVDPNITAWVSEYNDFIYNVYSNTQWNID